MEIVYPAVIGAALSMFKLQGLRFTITGREHIPRTGGAVMVINHTGYLEFTYAGLPALSSRRMVRFMAKESVFRHKISGPFMRAMKHIEVDREAGADAYRAAVQALKDGEIIGVFPEATISRSFELKAFKLGAARMAAEAGVPILPVIVWGSQRVWTKNHPKRLGRTKTPIHIAVGELIPVPPDADPQAVTDGYKAVMQRMLLQVQRTYPPMPPEEAHLLPARLGGTAPTLAEAAVIEEADRAARRAAREARTAREAQAAREARQTDATDS